MSPATGTYTRAVNKKTIDEIADTLSNMHSITAAADRERHLSLDRHVTHLALARHLCQNFRLICLAGAGTNSPFIGDGISFLSTSPSRESGGGVFTNSHVSNLYALFVYMSLLTYTCACESKGQAANLAARRDQPPPNVAASETRNRVPAAATAAR
jgi:hypothetical protein